MMADYVAIMLNGFSTGLGVIAAHEFYEWFKKHGLKKSIKIIKENKEAYDNNFFGSRRR
jgi:hypothetical protein